MRPGDVNAVTDSLACVVLSLRNEPGLVGAVRSLVDQRPVPELVVVNSGGGDPSADLRGAGLDVPVVNRAERLFPGAARNLGIATTTGRFVAFLAADCRAAPGWVAARLRAHRAGAAAVASVIEPHDSASRSSAAVQLLLYGGRMADTPPEERQLYGVSYDRSLFECFGRFREDLQGTEDREFNLRIVAEPGIVWSREVVTLHCHPTDPAAALAYLFGRGQREYWGRRGAGEGESASIPALLRHTADRLPRAARALRRPADDPAERRARRRSWPLLVPGTIAYAAGVLHASRRPERPLPIVRERLRTA